ncbi:polysaccharide biosynthesis C-terminal domain-containing protein [Alphaproteobacteria bacterium]|nr:polysaccharide biosynthesis C-terminal domain-containing protein [Alphaproteobacteria bacterium]
MSYFHSLGAVGVFGIWIAASLLLSQIGVFGFHNAITSFGTKNLSIDLSVVKTAYWAGSLWSVLLNLIIVFVCVFLASQKIVFESIEFGILLGTNIAIIGQTKLLVARCNMTYTNGVALANLVKSASLLFFIIISFSINFSAYAQLKIFLLAETVNLLALIFLTPRIKVAGEQTVLAFSSFKYLRNSFRFALNNFTFDAMTKVDLIMISIYFPVDVVGIYTIIMNVTEAFLGLATLKRGQYYWEILSMIKHAQEGKIIKFAKTQFANFSIFALPVFASGYTYLVIVSQTIELQTAIALALNILGILLFSPAMLSFNVFFGIKRTQTLTYFLLSALILNLTLNFLLIPILGIIGAALGTFSSFTLLSALINRFILQLARN